MVTETIENKGGNNMFNPDKLLFKQAISGQMFSPTDGVLFWTLEDLKDVNIQTNATSQDKTECNRCGNCKIL